LQVSSDRILLETDAPDALPNGKFGSLFLVDGGIFHPEGENSSSNADSLHDGDSHPSKDASALPRETPNHPANIHNVCHLLVSPLNLLSDNA
jgi:TatD DNase family protein